MQSLNFTNVWHEHLTKVLAQGETINPRGMPTLEIPHATIEVDMRKPVLLNTQRKLNYKFMVDEAIWVASGDNTVAEITKFNKNMANYSDDGVTLSGAYGPMYKSQEDYVTKALLNDIDTRQACMTFWRTNPAPSKDIPCTVSIDFKIRNGQLNAHVFMRSSDVWMGLPYDVFTFSMLAHKICRNYNFAKVGLLSPGKLYLTAASSHLYLSNHEAAVNLVGDAAWVEDKSETPVSLFTTTDDGFFIELKKARDEIASRWWHDHLI